MWCTRESVCWLVVHLYGCDCWLLHSMSVCHGEHITIPPGYTQKQSQCPSSWLTKKLTANDSQVRSSTHILLLVEVAALSLKDHQCSTHKVKIWIFFATGCKCFTRLFAHIEWKRTGGKYSPMSKGQSTSYLSNYQVPLYLRKCRKRCRNQISHTHTKTIHMDKQHYKLEENISVPLIRCMFFLS